MNIEKCGHELVWIPGGTFIMGSPEDEEQRCFQEDPQHKVTISGFYMGRYPVTNKEYEKFLRENPDMPKPGFWGDRNYNQPAQPVMGVSWKDAVRFAGWAGLALPTEAQWEYACRAGTTTRFSWGDEADCSRANYGNGLSVDCKDRNPGKSSPVGNYPPNPWGLYDMHGNVYEWCADWYEEDYYEKSPEADPTGPASGRFYNARGGSWNSLAKHCRSAFRGHYIPSRKFSWLGFRLAFSPYGKNKKG